MSLTRLRISAVGGLSFVLLSSAVSAQGTDSAGSGMAGMGSMPGMEGMPADSMQMQSGRMIVSMIKSPMIPGLEGAVPAVDWYHAGAGRAAASLAATVPSTEITVKNGDTVTLSAGLARRRVAGHEHVLFAFNGQSPGPRLVAQQGATFYVRFKNAIDLPATIHWHGVRISNTSDGAPQVTQPPVTPGGEFLYKVHCPDAGIFWYHDHVRGDIGQALGLYGNLVVEPATSHRVGEPARREFVILSDLLMDGDTLMPYGRAVPNFALMGRFGNVVLLNGDRGWRLAAKSGETVRFYFTNAANARMFNLRFPRASMRLIGSDLGPYMKQLSVESVAIAPGERYVVDVQFARSGDYPLLSEVQTVDHFLGEIYANSDTLGHVAVTGDAATPIASLAMENADSAAVNDIERYRASFDRAPDREIVLTTAIQGLPIPVMQMMAVDTVYRPPIEWTDGMSDMNWLATANEVRWIIRDVKTGAENMNVSWGFHTGDVVKLRVYNDPRSFHPMDHPLHLHGQRFLEVARDGKPNPYLVWKDTAVIPVGSTVDLLLDLSNPGKWMLHCHIAEHAESGMMAQLIVEDK